MESLFGILVIYVLGIVLVIVEMFTPGAIVGIMGLLCMAAAVLFGFQHSMGLGWTLLIISAASIPVFLFLWVHVIGRMFTMKETQAGYTSAQVDLKSLLGQEGVAITPLRPSGTVRIGDRKVDVVSESERVETNTRVRVIEVKSNRVVVRVVESGDTAAR